MAITYAAAVRTARLQAGVRVVVTIGTVVKWIAGLVAAAAALYAAWSHKGLS